MNRLLLIDGSSVLSTSFFGTVPREYHSKKPGDKEIALEKMMKTSDGRYTNGVYEMSKKMLKLIKDYDFSHISVAWDVDRNSLLRKKAFDGYKAHRGETEDELKSQFPLMQEVLDSMGIKQFAVRQHEADDIIGTFAKAFEGELQVVIMTKDQDALQLITENTRVWLNTSKTKEMISEYHSDLNPKEYKVMPSFFEHTPETFEYYYGLKPIQIIDKKALEGDSSDGIPGVKGCGEKAVVPLLKEFGTVESIYEYIESNKEEDVKAFFKELGATRALKPLLENKEMAFLSKQLATINCKMELVNGLQLEELRLSITEESMKKKFEELEFKSLLK